MELKMRLLGSLESHRKMPFKAIYKIFPHENKIAIIRGLIQLRNEGWIKLRKQLTINGDTVKWLNASRTSKEMYQPQLIPFID